MNLHVEDAMAFWIKTWDFTIFHQFTAQLGHWQAIKLRSFLKTLEIPPYSAYELAPASAPADPAGDVIMKNHDSVGSPVAKQKTTFVVGFSTTLREFNIAIEHGPFIVVFI